MITEDKSIHKEKSTGGLQNNIPQSNDLKRDDSQASRIGKPVNNGGVSSKQYQVNLEKQWLAVRDQYLANFPETKNLEFDTNQDNLEILISDIADKRKKSTEEIHEEIMNWPHHK